MCNCVKQIDSKLAEHNTRLSLAFAFTAPHVRLMIRTEVIEKKRGARAMTIFPSFCPFCGEKYLSKDGGQEQERK